MQILLSNDLLCTFRAGEDNLIAEFLDKATYATWTVD